MRLATSTTETLTDLTTDLVMANNNNNHLKFCVVCINSRGYVCCSECDVSNECNEPTSCLVQPIGAHCCEVMYFGCLALGVSLVS